MYKGYKLKNSNGMFHTYKARPYDEAEYYWAYSTNKVLWNVVYRGRRKAKLHGTFESVVDYLEVMNSGIKPEMQHN